jgi:archaellum component FlaG (FlaF/FlaG flagellin family)
VVLWRFPVTATGASSILGPGNFNAILRAQAAGANFTTYLTYLPLDFTVKKLTNGRDADGANDADVPIIFPRAPVTWTYLVTNTGAMAIPLADIAVTDSDPHVAPLFDPASDDGDRILAPGEVWRYYAVGTALDLSVAERSPLVVDGCRGTTDPQTLRAYENFVTVTIRDVAKMDPSHYCNPTTRRLEPALAFAKLINGFDADGPNDRDVPFVFPGTVVTWTYLVTNTGNISFTFDQVTLQDDDRSLQINFDATSDDGDAMLQPSEQWRFFASAAARNLLFDTTSITIVAGCDPSNSGNKSAAYRNIGMVTVGNLRLTDPAHYCNFPPTEITDDSRGRGETRSLYLPLVAR